jgi:large subunit ribosomal protein L31
VVCGCGNTFTVGATVPEIQTEICSACHPFFTGEQRIVDTAGQVERFMRRLEEGQRQREERTATKEERRAAERAAKRERRGLTPLQATRAAAPKEPATTAEDDAGG